MKMNNKNVSDRKAKNFKLTWKKLILYAKPYLPVIIVSLIAVIGATIFQIIGPDKTRALSNEIMNILLPPSFTMNYQKVIDLIIVLFIFYVSSMILNIIQNYIMSSVSQKITYNMRNDLSQKINKVPLKYFDSTSHGDTISRFTNDVDIIGQTLNQSVATFVSAIVLLIGVTFMMFYTSWILALVAILSSIIGFALTGVIMAKSQKYFISQQKDLGSLNGYIEEAYTNQNIIKVYNASEKSIDNFKEINNKLYSSGWKSQFLSGLMMPLMTFIGNFGYLSVTVVGALLIYKKNYDFGMVMAFIIYVKLFTNALVQLAQVSNNFQRTAASAERVFEFLEEQELEDESHKNIKINEVNGLIEFENVKFGYEKDNPIIHNFSAYVKPGQKIAIVGPTGAGKTTIINLLMRFYEIDEGTIKIDGISTKDITRENVHELFGMVLQDTWIFEGTVLENIIYSQENVTKEQVVKACKKLGIHHFIKTLPNGYETVLTEKASLSEGQKQIITIARAMIKNAPLLILDEATSSVDTRLELIVQNAMDELMKDRTSFIIAHRLSTIKNADLILVLKDGDIIEKGTHESLLRKNGFYAELYNSQFES